MAFAAPFRLRCAAPLAVRAVPVLIAGLEPATVETEVQTLFSFPDNWTFLLATVTLALGGAFEVGIEALEEVLPASVLPVVRKLLVEFATLGFVGLLIEAFSEDPRTSSWLQSVSQRFLEEPDVLLELFEGVHKSLFNVSIFYFCACTVESSTGSLTRALYFER